MRTTLLQCEECDKTFERKSGEVNRSRKLGRKFFCSLNCSCKYYDRERMSKGEIFSLPKKYIGKGSCKTKMSEFKPLLYLINRRKKERIINLTIDDVKDIWDKQNGICVYTKMKLKLPIWNKKKEINTASMDRIDPSKGYEKDNCQIISVMANFAKNDFSDNDMKEFCKQIYENYKRTLQAS